MLYKSLAALPHTLYYIIMSLYYFLNYKLHHIRFKIKKLKNKNIFFSPPIMDSLHTQGLIPYFHPNAEFLSTDGSYIPISQLTPRHTLMSPTNNDENAVSSIYAIIEMKTYNNAALFVYNQETNTSTFSSPNIIFLTESKSKSFQIKHEQTNHVYIIVLKDNNSLVSKNYMYNVPSISHMTENNNDNYFQSIQFKNDLERYDNFPNQILHASHFNFKMDGNKIIMLLSNFREYWILNLLTQKPIHNYTPIEKFIASLHQNIVVN